MLLYTPFFLLSVSHSREWPYLYHTDQTTPRVLIAVKRVGYLATTAWYRKAKRTRRELKNETGGSLTRVTPLSL